MMKKRHTRLTGAATVEFAILLIPLLVILTGITEVGRAMYYYNTLVKSVRNAARLLSTQAPTDPDYPSLKNTAVCLAVYGNTDCTGVVLIPGLNVSMVNVCDAATCADTHAGVATGTGVINIVTVTIGTRDHAYIFESLGPFDPALFGVSPFTFAPISSTMRQII